MSVMGGNSSPINNQMTNALRKLEEQLNALQFKFQADQHQKAQSNAVDVFALKNNIESQIKKIELKNEEHLKRVIQTEVKINGTQQEVHGIAHDLKQKISKIG